MSLSPLLDYCSLSKESGDCSSDGDGQQNQQYPQSPQQQADKQLARWHYSESDRKCLPFYFTGCGGNNNNFISRQSCEDHCPKEVGKIQKRHKTLKSCFINL